MHTCFSERVAFAQNVEWGPQVKQTLRGDGVLSVGTDHADSLPTLSGAAAIILCPPSVLHPPSLPLLLVLPGAVRMAECGLQPQFLATSV